MKTIDMVYIALFTAVTAVLGIFPPIPVPVIPVPITLQSFGVMLAGAVLGAKRGFLSLLVFDLLVLIGAPVLSGGRGGLEVLVGPSGGYIMAYPIASFVTGLLADRLKTSYGWMLVASIIGGIFVVYAGGILYYSFISGTPILAATFSNFAFVPGDLIKALVASYLAIRLRKALPNVVKKKATGVA